MNPFAGRTPLDLTTRPFILCPPRAWSPLPPGSLCVLTDGTAPPSQPHSLSPSTPDLLLVFFFERAFIRPTPRTPGLPDTIQWVVLGVSLYTETQCCGAQGPVALGGLQETPGRSGTLSTCHRRAQGLCFPQGNRHHRGRWTGPHERPWGRSQH